MVLEIYIAFLPYEIQGLLYFICCILFQVENAKGLCHLTDRVNELLTDSLFYEALNGIRNWIDQAGVDTTQDDVKAKINETENIVC